MVNKLRVQEKLKAPVKFFIDFQIASDDDIFQGKELLEFLKTHMKVNEKRGNIEGNVIFAINKHRINVETSVKFSKRYLKYLTKKFLKKKEIIEYIRLVAVDKSTYKLKYVNEEKETEETK